MIFALFVFVFAALPILTIWFWWQIAPLAMNTLDDDVPMHQIAKELEQARLGIRTTALLVAISTFGVSMYLILGPLINN